MNDVQENTYQRAQHLADALGQSVMIVRYDDTGGVKLVSWKNFKVNGIGKRQTIEKVIKPGVGHEFA